MPISCFNCGATSNLHGPPNQIMQQKWLNVIPNIQKDSFDHNFGLCSVHFDDRYFNKGGLLWDAVPTKFYVNGSWVIIPQPVPVPVVYTITEPVAVVTDHFQISTDNGGLNITRSQGIRNKSVRQRKKFRFVGDIDTNVVYSPEITRQALILCKKEIENQRRRNRTLCAQLRRMRTQLNGATKFMKELEAEGII